MFDRYVPHHRPEKSDELAGDRDDSDLGPFAVRQVVETLMQSLLSFPGMHDPTGILPLLSSLEIDARLRPMTIAPRCLHEYVPAVAVILKLILAIRNPNLLNSCECSTLEVSLDHLTFIAAVLQGVAWPITVLIAILLVRRPIVAVLPRLRNLSFRDVKAEFSEHLAAAEREADEAKLPVASPVATNTKSMTKGGLSSVESPVTEFSIAFAPASAIDAAWNNLVNAMEHALRREGVEGAVTERAIEEVLESRGIVPPKTIEFVRSLKDARSRAVQLGDVGVNRREASEFVKLAGRLVVALEGPVIPRE